MNKKWGTVRKSSFFSGLDDFMSAMEKEEKEKEEEPKVLRPTIDVGFTLFKNTYDNCVVYQSIMKWEDAVDFILDREVVWGRDIDQAKKNTKNIVPGLYKEYDYEPAKEKDKQTIKFNEDGKPHIKRCAKNLDKVTMIPLDFDGGSTLEEVKGKLKDYTYLGYTSIRHRHKDKGGVDAFRIFIPLRTPISKESYEYRQDSIMNWLSSLGLKIDETSLDISRIFYLPSKMNDDNTDHKEWKNDGEFINPNIFEELIPPPPPPPRKPKARVKGSVIKRGRIIWDSIDIVGIAKALGCNPVAESGDAQGIHLIDCPFPHASKSAGGTVIYTDGIHPKTKDNIGPVFTCRHNSCKGKTIKDLVQELRDRMGEDAIYDYCDVEPYENDRIELLKLFTAKEDSLERQIKKLEEKKRNASSKEN